MVSGLDSVEKLPMLAPALIDVIIELADIPDRARVLERVRRLIPPELGGPMPLGGVPPMPGGPGGPGGPPNWGPGPAGPTGPPMVPTAPSMAPSPTAVPAAA